MNRKRIKIDLPNDKQATFFDYPLDAIFECYENDTKYLPAGLVRILADPSDNSFFQSVERKIFIGFSSSDPTSQERVPLWLPVDLLNLHVCIAGATGSGKTSLLYRLITGALRQYGTVIVGEAQGGEDGFPEGAAFTELSKYLSHRLAIPRYRWPCGNCWFNPLQEIKSESSRREFFESIIDSLDLKDDLKFFGDKVIDIIMLLINLLQIKWLVEYKSCAEGRKELDNAVNLRELTALLDVTRGPASLTSHIDSIRENLARIGEEDFESNIAEKLNSIETTLDNCDYFDLGNKDYIATRNVISRLRNTLNNENILHYTEPHAKGLDGEDLTHLSVDKLFSKKSLVVVSQPIGDVASKLIGSIFWGVLHSKAFSLGIYDEKEPQRNKLLVIFDEANELPAGKLGEKLGAVRQRGIGLVFVFPEIVNENQWDSLNQTCQTLISVSPGLPKMVNFLYDLLPEAPREVVVRQILKDGVPYIESWEDLDTGKRSLLETGKYTALIFLKNPRRLFWVDLESSLLRELDTLLKCNSSEKKQKVVDYALALSNRIDLS